MSYFFIISNYPVGFIESQLSFSGEIIKSHLAVTDIANYRIGQLLDYGFMIRYGIIGFCLTLIIGRKYSKDSLWAKSSPFTALFIIFAAVCDGIENIFILLMLLDPINFPNIIAFIHSCFALIKYILIVVSIGWVIISGLNLMVRKIRKH
jgi:hypothetical protein